MNKENNRAKLRGRQPVYWQLLETILLWQ